VQKLIFLNCLKQAKKMGRRGHERLDNIEILLSVIFFLFLSRHSGFPPLLFAIIITIPFILIMNPANYQQDPTIFDLKEAKKRMESQLKEN
jgi:hypothetical protein